MAEKLKNKFSSDSAQSRVVIMGFVRHFRWLSFVAIVAAAIAIGLLYRVVATQSVIQVNEESSIALARMMSNHVDHGVTHSSMPSSETPQNPGMSNSTVMDHSSMPAQTHVDSDSSKHSDSGTPEHTHNAPMAAMDEHSSPVPEEIALRSFSYFARNSEHLSPVELMNHPHNQALKMTLEAMIRGTAVLKFKIYAPTGRTIFSTAPSEFGQPKDSSELFNKALNDRVASKLVVADDNERTDSVLRGKNFVETYVPMHSHDAHGKTPIVFELYYDVTPTIAKLRTDLAMVIAGAFLILMAVYAALILIVKPADRMMRKQYQDNLMLSQAVDQSASMILITDENGVIEYANPQFMRMTGYKPAEVLGLTPKILKSGETSNEIYEELWTTIKRGRTWQGEIQNRKKSGDIYWEFQTISPVRNEAGDVIKFVAIKEDITDRKEAARQIEHLAMYDSLTELPNRANFMDRLNVQLAHAKRSGGRLALVFIDLDDFKDVNDTLGHQAGDELLKASAVRMSETARETDVVARLGGDEFAIVLSNMDSEQDAASLCERLIDSMSEPFHLDDSEVYVGASMGIAIYPNDGESPERLLRNADLALYRSKDQGSNTYHFYEAEMDTKVLEVKLLARDLRQAIAENELELYYQPIMDLRTNEVIAVEALLRWHHPRRGLVEPDEFIPIAEHTRMIVAIGEWVLIEACKQNKEWLDMNVHQVPVAVNLSLVQFQHMDLSALVARVLAETGLEPEMLELEITESVAMENSEEVRGTLQELRDMGISIALDDFGTGYSSLHHLRELPIDKLKIDKSFLPISGKDVESTAIIDAILKLGEGLKMNVAVEGVEHDLQLNFLQQMGCREAQGYLFSVPVPRGKYETFVKELSREKLKNSI